MTAERLIAGLLVCGGLYVAFIVLWRFSQDVPIFP